MIGRRDDLAQARRRFAVPRSRPTDRMACWDVARIAAHPRGGELAELLELGDVRPAGGRLEPPMRMQLVFALASRWIHPYPTGTHHERCRAEQSLQHCECGPRALVEFD